MGTVSLSDEELEDMSLDISYSEGTRLITFILGEEKYGLDILQVRELISFPEELSEKLGSVWFLSSGSAGQLPLDDPEIQGTWPNMITKSLANTHLWRKALVLYVFRWRPFEYWQNEATASS